MTLTCPSSVTVVEVATVMVSSHQQKQLLRTEKTTMTDRNMRMRCRRGRGYEKNHITYRSHTTTTTAKIS